MGINQAKRFFKLILVLSIATSLLSCASRPEELDTLDSSFRAYERAIRWGSYTQAKSFHKSNPVLNDLERRRLKLYQITGYRVISEDVPNLNNAFRLVELKYYRSDSAVLKTISFKQDWKRDKGTDTWYIKSSFPKIR